MTGPVGINTALELLRTRARDDIVEGVLVRELDLTPEEARQAIAAAHAQLERRARPVH